ncbi:MAG: phosphoglycerate kinase [Sphaerochaetaceae bacterium]|nr:phosphoglycerate kinase [Sphaerochaetaceae bacterium]
MGSLGFTQMSDMDVRNKRVLLRVDINSPLDVETHKIINENRLDKTVPTIQYLVENKAMVGIIAHQGDTLDYQNLISMEEHAKKLSEKLKMDVEYIDDVCGPAATAKIDSLKGGEVVLLGNLRYLSEEISTFENSVKLKAEDMLDTYLVRSLAPHFDLYINDAFSAAHRNAPSMVAFQQLLPSAAGPLFFNEVSTLEKIMNNPSHPSTFVLGGAKISDAFGMMESVLSNKSADHILTCGVTGEVFRIASGMSLGSLIDGFLQSKGLMGFVKQAKELLLKFPGKIEMPVDLAYDKDGSRAEVVLDDCVPDLMFMDIGSKTIEKYSKIIGESGTIFVNGPAGVYENPIFENGTKSLWKAMEMADGFTCIGGGDSVTAATKFTDLKKMNYVCTAGGAMVRFLSGVELPLIKAMRGAKRQIN